MLTESTQANAIQLSATAGALLLAYYIVPYMVDPYGYRQRFNGPWLAAFTNMWSSNAARGGRRSEIIRELHMKHGTFVRIGPNHISIADPAALEAVYGQGSGLLKSDFYDSFVTKEVDIFSAQDKAVHTAKRKRIANVFSQQNILAYQPRVRRLIQQLCDQWDMRCGEASRDISGFNWTAKDGKAVIDCCPQFAYLAFDIIGDLALGVPFRLIEAQKDAAPIAPSTSTLQQIETEKLEHVPVIRIMLNGATTAASVGSFPSWAQKIMRLVPWHITGFTEQLNLVRLAIAALNSRLEKGPQTLIDGCASVDMVDKFLEIRNEDAVATIYRRYDIELAHPMTKLQVTEAFARTTVHCEVAIKRRELTGKSSPSI